MRLLLVSVQCAQFRERIQDGDDVRPFRLTSIDAQQATEIGKLIANDLECRSRLRCQEELRLYRLEEEIDLGGVVPVEQVKRILD